MNKGFTKVESNCTLLFHFHQICTESNQRIESVLPQLKKHIQYTSVWKDEALKTELFNQSLYIDLLHIRNILNENIIQVSDFVENFSEIWAKSFSLSALLKFKLLLINEFSLLEREIQNIEMDQVNQNRIKQINLHRSATRVTEGTGL
jgi:hypothetical protein